MASDSSHPSEKDVGNKKFPEEPTVQHKAVSEDGTTDDDADQRLANMGYRNEFKREFASLSTFSFAMAIMGLISSVITTFNIPWVSGGGPTVIWTWFMGSVLNMSLGLAIGELVSAYPSAGGLYTVSGLVVPKPWAPVIAYGVGWANGLGQVAGICGSCYGLSSMIMSWAFVVTNGSYVSTPGEVVGVFCAVMVVAGLLNSFPTSWLARFTASYVFVNIITTCVISILVLARTPRDEFLSGSEAFVTLNNNSGWPDGLAFLVGLQMVQFVMTDYDATAHISEEVHRAAIAAPVAIVQAVFATGLLGFFLNICLVFASGDIGVDLASWPGELAVAQILLNRGGRTAFLIVWPFACCVAFFVVVTATQANARSFYALARDRAIPVFFAKVNKKTRITLNAVWLVVVLNIILVMLSFASYYAVAAVFALAALGMDLSYWVPILCRQLFSEHPDVQFHKNRGPFYMGQGIFAKVVNWIAIWWTLFEVVILVVPTSTPVTALTMNWSSVVFGGVMILSYSWYAVYARHHYRGPNGYAHEHTAQSEVVQEIYGKVGH